MTAPVCDMHPEHVAPTTTTRRRRRTMAITAVAISAIAVAAAVHADSSTDDVIPEIATGNTWS